MDWTTFAITAVSIGGTGAVSLAVQRLGQGSARRDRREADADDEARELRRESRQRGREAAEGALRSVMTGVDNFELWEPEGDHNDEVAEAVTGVVQTQAVYLPDDVRGRLEDCCRVLGGRFTAAQWGAGTAGRVGTAALWEMREALGGWLRTSELPPTPGDRWSAVVVAEALAGIQENWEMNREAEAEMREAARRDRDE